MDFWSTIRVLLRRWYIALPIFVVSLGLAGGVYLSVSAQYESTGTVVLTSPASGARVPAGEVPTGEMGNPLLAFDGSLTTSAQIIIQSLKDPAVAKQFEGVEYEVGDGQLSGPFVVVTVTAPSADAAQRTVAGLLERARQELTARQESLQAPESTYIRADPVISPTPAETLVGGKVRFAAVALVLGLIACLTAAYGYESYSQRKRPQKTDAVPERLPRAREARPVGARR